MIAGRDIDPKTRAERRWHALKSERSSFDAHWKSISRVLLPRSSRFLTSETNRGERANTDILDNSATRALRILGAGMVSGMTSPARPWFRLGLADRDLAEYEPVKRWLFQTRGIMLDIFQRSNTYRALHSHYLHLGAFGTSASFSADSDTTLVHHHSLPVGQYCIATDPEGTPNTLFRELRKPVAEIVAEFGYARCSQSTRSAYDNGNLDQWVEILHAIEPRPLQDRKQIGPLGMPWASTYWERSGESKMNPLRESGYKRFRGLVSRWDVEGNDIYGTYCPGMDALGDIRQLQHEQLRKAHAIDYKTKPPLQVPTALKNQEVETFPGGVTYYDGGPGQKIESLWNVNLDMGHLLDDIMDVRGRINSAFYADLFLMLSSANKDMTATEVAERHEEKLLALGPVLENLHNELLDPLIEQTFERMIETANVPPPPPELDGVEINVEFISMLAQAQRAVATQSVDRFVMNMGAVAQVKPEVLDKFDADKWVDLYADALGLDPSLIVAGEQVAFVRQQRAEQQAAAQQAAMVAEQADSAQKLGGVPTQGGQSNALNDIIGLFSGYNSPSAENY